MTDKELRRLKRTQLLEMMITLSEENEELRKQLDQQKKRMESRAILINSSGSIAEAALNLSGVFKAAQDAADLYLENAQRTKENAQREADELMTYTQRKCAEMTAQAQREADRKWEPLKAMMDRYVEAHNELKNALGSFNRDLPQMTDGI